jgi:hypothetical protein
MNRNRDQACLLLAAILLLYAVLAAWYSVTVPLGEAPDEVPHFTYVRYLAQHGRLPTTEEEHEAFQPPLYYALGAAVTFWIEDRRSPLPSGPMPTMIQSTPKHPRTCSCTRPARHGPIRDGPWPGTWCG